MLSSFIQQAPKAPSNDRHPAAGGGFVLYDGRCRMCRSTVRMFAAPLRKRGFRMQPLQRRWVADRLSRQRDELISRMWVFTNDGDLFGGADGVLYLSRFFWWALPLRAFSRLPGGTALLDRMYQFVASHRQCDGASCTGKWNTRQRRWLDWMPLIALPAIALACGSLLPAWLWMWAIAYALFAGCKWLTWRRAIRTQRHVSVCRSIGYLFGWPGMNAREFLSGHRASVGTTKPEWAAAMLKTVAGIATLWIGCRLISPTHSLLLGWVGMIGMVTFLHFGVFHLLSLVWRRAGVNAPHLFRNPVAARSIADFWGRRWNLGFRVLSHEFVFAPLCARIGATHAMAITFIVSGLVHDLVISIPAGGGYGLPTAYFALQSLGLMLERSRLAVRLGMRGGIGGYVVLLVFTAAPAFLLFHPAFVERVIVPFLDVIGAI